MLIEVLQTGSRITLSTGHVVLGEPQDNDEYRETARRLGYGDDTLQCCRDHDPLHMRLAQWLGFHESFSLLCAAGVRDRDEISAAEEDAVCAVQRFARLSGARLPLLGL